VGAPEAAAATGLDASAVGPGATGTNVQEVGVDEPDLLKSADGRLVAVRSDRLYVLDVTGDEPRKLGSVALPAGAAGELLLSGERALVLGTAWTAAPSPAPADDAVPPGDGVEPAPDRAASTMPAFGSTAATLTVVDLADPTTPTVVHSEEIEGAYVSARERDGVIRIVLQSTPWQPFANSTPGSAPAQEWLPQRIERNAGGEVTARTPLLDCADVRHPAKPAGIGVVTVLTLDIDAPAELDAVAVATDGNLVYASTQRLYVATTSGGWFGMAAIREPAETQVRTHLHAFDVTQPTTTTYVGSGVVDGWLLGRWAMSEDGGRLRVATTRGTPSAPADAAPGTDAAITVLEERGEQLEQVGTVGGLGQGEEIRAVRWFGDIATVVTFRQTDPLYTVDLSDPANPQVLGELKVPGYSAYLHPLGDGLLLGVGQDATDQGQVLGTQVSTFDLTDLTAPRRIDTLVEPGSWSDVEADSRLFSYLPDSRTAVLPVSGPTGSALLSYAVAADGGVTEAGRWAPGRDGWVVRALPIGDGRLAVLDEGGAGATLTLVTAGDLSEMGSAPLR
jgi:hypothetical protein